MMKRDYLINTEKLKYINGEKPHVDCILCEIRDKNPDVQSLEITRTEFSILTVNLYPYNVGHLMVFPQRHVLNYEELLDTEIKDMGILTRKAIEILKEEFNPSGFNLGFNIGESSGASISHLHQHIVPRFNNEIGFMDVLCGTRIIVIDPVEVLERVKKHFN